MKNWTGKSVLEKSVRQFIRKNRRSRKVLIGYRKKTNSLM